MFATLTRVLDWLRVTCKRERMPYQVALPADLKADLHAWAELCRSGRDCFAEASDSGFLPAAGSPAAHWEAHALDPAWPGGPWPANGPTGALHQVALILSNSAAGRLGELGALLDSQEVVWSVPTNVRGVLEVCARLYRVFVRPMEAHVGSTAPDIAGLEMYASAHLLVIESAFTARTNASEYLKLDPTNANRIAAKQHADSELARLTVAFGQHYDAATTDTTSKKTLRLGGVSVESMTEVIDSLAAWMWPNPAQRPMSLYRLFSGFAHSSLDSEMELFEVSDTAALRKLTRTVDRGFLTVNIVAATVIFQRIFAALTGFYGWPEAPLHTYSDRLATIFPQHFKYGP